MEQLLKEGYQTRHREGQDSAHDFENTDLVSPDALTRFDNIPAVRVRFAKV